MDVNQKLDNWQRQIQEITSAYQEAFGGLTPEQLNLKPNPSRWSIGQNIDHVIRINESYFALPEAIRSGEAPALPGWSRLPFLARMMGGMILKSVSPDRKRKISTFPIWEPSQSKLPADILSQFVTHQQALARFFGSCEDLLARNIVISSPANRNIVYPLATAFDIMLAHEERHLNQAKEVLVEMEKS